MINEKDWAKILPSNFFLYLSRFDKLDILVEVDRRGEKILRDANNHEKCILFQIRRIRSVPGRDSEWGT